LTRQTSVTLARFDRSVDAEVARTVLELEGIDCQLTAAADGAPAVALRVAESYADAAARLLDASPNRPSGPRSAACPACRGRHVIGQSHVFWAVLAIVLIVTVLVAMFTSFRVLVVVSAVAAVLLAGIEILMKDWRCVRCGKRWRESASGTWADSPELWSSGRIQD